MSSAQLMDVIDELGALLNARVVAFVLSDDDGRLSVLTPWLFPRLLRVIADALETAGDIHERSI